MTTDRVNDLQAFRDFLDSKLNSDGATLTLDEALGLWENENQSEQEYEETLESIRRGLADVEAGRVRPAEDAINEIRRKFNLPDLS